MSAEHDIFRVTVTSLFQELEARVTECCDGTGSDAMVANKVVEALFQCLVEEVRVSKGWSA